MLSSATTVGFEVVDAIGLAAAIGFVVVYTLGLFVTDEPDAVIGCEPVKTGLFVVFGLLVAGLLVAGLLVTGLLVAVLDVPVVLT